MKQIVGFTDDAHQEMTLITDEGEEVTLTLNYMPSQDMWTYDIEYGDDFATKGNRLCAHPNLLRAFQNIIPFGLICVVPAGGEPWFIDDLSTERVVLYLINSSEVQSVETDVFTKT